MLLQTQEMWKLQNLWIGASTRTSLHAGFATDASVISAYHKGQEKNNRYRNKKKQGTDAKKYPAHIVCIYSNALKTKEQYTLWHL